VGNNAGVWVMAEGDSADILREAKALRDRAQDRNDLWTEQQGVSNCRMRRPDRLGLMRV